MPKYTARRLTPLECERLMGFPDNYTLIDDWRDSSGRMHRGDQDAPRFRALGNSIAGGRNSFWDWVLRRISAQYDYRPTMASLFDGIGGFPLIWDDINGDGSTLWASEIDEFTINVTKKHLSLMQHYGDITKINGADVPVVDCIIGGSPCQDFSVAGSKAGTKHSDLGDDETTRSGLFMDYIRVIKEMRDKDELSGRTGEYIRPRYCVFENVKGAILCNKGKEFKTILEEICKICGGGGITIPKPTGWLNNGVIMGDGFSIAWTIHNARNWGIPQSRERLCVIADFGGYSAPEILFKSKGLSGNIGEERKAQQTPSSDNEGSAGSDNRRHGKRSFGFDPQANRDVGKVFIEECSKTIVNGTRAGWYTGVITVEDD